jgi:acetate kinase
MNAAHAPDVRILVLNAGTATLKAARVDIGPDGTRAIERAECGWNGGEAASERLQAVLEQLDPDCDAIAHRVVHGGKAFQATTVIDEGVEHVIESLIALAPLHNARALDVIRASRAQLPVLPACAAFDTAFHSARPQVSVRYPLPEDLVGRFGLYRYGFHGLAHASLIEATARASGLPAAAVSAVTLQLGSGCSACAIRAGRPIETSMGFSPLDGLMMATRCGSIDPTIVLQLVRAGISADEIEIELNRRSGLLAIGGAGDVRALLEAEAEGSERARFALELFVARIVATVGAYFTLLEGEGGLVFGGGIGANSAVIRARVAAGLACWSIALAPDRNAGAAPGLISGEASRDVFAFATDEESVIAREAAQLLRHS